MRESSVPLFSSPFYTRKPPQSILLSLPLPLPPVKSRSNDLPNLPIKTHAITQSRSNKLSYLDNLPVQDR
jgi:hypothetical protein